MKTKLFSAILSVAMILSIIPMGIFTASAETSGYFTYTVENGEATITRCDGSASGDIAIPVTIDGYLVTSIGKNAFGWCVNLTSITIPDSVTGIGSQAFYHCISLASITIPSSVTSMGDFVFWDCSSLTSVTILSDVTSIAAGTFSACISLTNITIPDSVTSIGASAFSGCSSLTSITIPSGVTSIGSTAFKDCNSLSSITIPDSVTSIGSSAFSNCSSLTSITIPDSVTEIGAGAFESCSSLEKVYIFDIFSWCEIDFENNYSNPLVYADQLFLNGKPLINVEIPFGITEIQGYLFSCETLVSISIPNSVTRIASYAFSDCTSMASISIPESVTYIEEYAFWGCSSLAAVSIPDTLKSMAVCAFSGCGKLASISIPDGVATIKYRTFEDCKSLESIAIPDSITRIGTEAFIGCESLKSVYYGGSAEEWREITVLSGNDYLQNATVYYNSTGIPVSISSVTVSKLPNKTQYYKSFEELDLTGGILTVNYANGTSVDIDLTTLNVEGFDNSVLGKQTLTVKYEEYSANFDVEVIERPISFIAISAFPAKTVYTVGDSLDLTGGKLVIGYSENVCVTIDLTSDMVSDYNMNQSGYQILTVTYKEHTTKFTIGIFEKADLDCNGYIGASDIAILKKQLLSNIAYDLKFDLNADGSIDICDLVHIKKLSVNLNA